MTTTLRPTGPESRTAEGRRSRAYEVCVNSRPVGAVTLLGPSGDGPAVGRLERLFIEEGERRRGRGTVAALAAEEALRGWGCTQVEANVRLDGLGEGEDAGGAGEAIPAGVRLLGVLGYTEHSRHMIKQLGERPRLPPGSAVRPLTEGEFDAWWEAGAATFIEGLVARGFTPEQAAARSAAARRTQLPDSAASPGTALRVLTRDGTDVGSVWLGFTGLPRTDVDAWVYDINVTPERRGEGHGRSLMLAAEQVCLDAGARRLGLNVFAGNTTARRLYTSLGFRPVQGCYVKTLL
ncbi:GNAT family N-acetyltransferase [Streptomyces sp. 891-h]|uniref:GNAT family N-acetyltransferase n=1 Tax=Streptomyces sp. 891-h TaxID=2720714 RepID=UPI001FAA59D8|nr:GNAT family N-acetyltransferase [Streptomyces sp. 891-h]UNZ20350.1 GNAT family N-acetyltransferase [Streptomyces sp. 891-h]